MKKLILLFAALLVAGCGEKTSSEGSDSASEKAVASNESSRPSPKGQPKSEEGEESRIESKAKPEPRGLPPIPQTVTAEFIMGVWAKPHDEREFIEELKEKNASYEKVIEEQNAYIKRLASQLAEADEVTKSAKSPQTASSGVPVKLPRGEGALLPGMHVRIQGLQKRSDLNSKAAKVMHFDAASGRYKCELVGNTASGATIGCLLQSLVVQESNAAEETKPFSTPSSICLHVDDDDAKASGVHGPLDQSLLAHTIGASRREK